MMAQVNAGRVRFVGRGEYNNSTQYYVFDLVSYNGNSYYAKADTIGNLPTNTTYWQLVAEKGNIGPTGLTGNGISSITKTSTSGLVDTYTITYTNGNTTTFDVSNGNGIDRIEKTAAVGNKDTYTIYFTNGSTTTYEVSNGEVTREELEEEVERLSMIYNAFPTTTGEVEEPSINGTAEVPFKEIGLKGNTSQESTTGKNLFNANNYIQQGGYGGISIKNNEDGSYTITGTATDNVGLNLTSTPIILENGETYTQSITIINGTQTGSLVPSFKNSQGQITYNFFANNQTKTTTDVMTLNNYDYYISNGTTVNFTFKVQLEKSASATSWEPYTNGPAPNPDYPYPVNVVTGDNEVKVVGKNKFNPPSDYTGTFRSNVSRTLTIQNGVFNIGGSGGGTSYAITLGSSYTIQNGDYLHIFNDDSAFNIYLVDSSNNNIAEIIVNSNNKIVSLDSYAGQTIVSVLFYVNASQGNKTFTFSPMIINGVSIATTYTPYVSQTYPINLGSMELCKIGDYQDVIKRSSGKNLINPNNIVQGVVNNDNGNLEGTTTSNNKTIDYTEIKPNTSYYFLSNKTSGNWGAWYDENKTYISGISLGAVIDGVKVSPSNAKYLRFTLNREGNNNDYLTNTMICEGTSSSTYEPYGKVWCKYGAIGKVVFTGSNDEDWSYNTIYNFFAISISTITNNFVYANYYLYYPTYSSISGNYGCWISSTSFRIKNTDYNTAEDFKTWLSNNNVLLYYPLATPTITEITDTTLIEQLDNLEKAYSYDTQTNISQTNQDKPFIISYEAILSLKNVLNS